MNRREVLKSVGLIVGGTVVGADAFLSSCSFSNEPGGILSQKHVNLVEEIAETILPHTKQSPGAKDAQVGPFINRIVSDYYTIAEQQVFMEALTSFQTMKFADLKKEKREAHLLTLEKDTKTHPFSTYTNDAGETFETRSAYIMIKQLSIWAFLSSEIVAKNGFNFLPIPGKYDPCVTVTPEVQPMYGRSRPGNALRKIERTS